MRLVKLTGFQLFSLILAGVSLAQGINQYSYYIDFNMHQKHDYQIYLLSIPPGVIGLISLLTIILVLQNKYIVQFCLSFLYIANGITFGIFNTPNEVKKLANYLSQDSNDKWFIQSIVWWNFYIIQIVVYVILAGVHFKVGATLLKAKHQKQKQLQEIQDKKNQKIKMDQTDDKTEFHLFAKSFKLYTVFDIFLLGVQVGYCLFFFNFWAFFGFSFGKDYLAEQNITYSNFQSWFGLSLNLIIIIALVGSYYKKKFTQIMYFFIYLTATLYIDFSDNIYNQSQKNNVIIFSILSYGSVLLSMVVALLYIIESKPNKQSNRYLRLESVLTESNVSSI